MPGIDKKTVKIIALSVAAALILFAAVFAVKSVVDWYNYRPVDVVIDPGHGGDDLGAVYGSRNEKDDNLNLALLVAQELEEREITYKLTREKDEFISLEERCITANERTAKLFVALHRNSAENAEGVEIWINSEDPQKDRTLAENIMSELAQTGISENRGVKTGYARADGKNYFVNSHTEMPSCLVELGFITSEKDNSLYDENLEDYAEAIADGIQKTLNELN